MYTNYPFGVCLAHNGNLTNVAELRERVFAEARHINTDSVRAILDVELVLYTWYPPPPVSLHRFASSGVLPRGWALARCIVLEHVRVFRWAE